MGRCNHGLSSNLVYYDLEARLRYLKAIQAEYEQSERERERERADRIAVKAGRPTSKDLADLAAREADYQKRRAAVAEREIRKRGAGSRPA